MGIIKTDEGRLVLSNAKYLHITPYTDEDTIGEDTYDIVNIVGDTLSFTPDDNTVNEKEWEFGDTPLFENITLGKIQFAGTCIDFQNKVLKNIFGWTEGESGTMYAPSSYKDLYAVVEVGFHNEDAVVVVPKLKLNSKAVISTMKTGTSEGQLAGTAYNATLAVGSDEAQETPMAIITNAEGKTYKVGTDSFTVEGGKPA